MTPSCRIVFGGVEDAPVLVCKTIVTKAHDVDCLHVDALAGRGDAHELALMGTGAPDPRDDLVAAGKNVLRLHPQVGEGGNIHPEEGQDPLLRRLDSGRLLVLDEVVGHHLTEPINIP